MGPAPRLVTKVYDPPWGAIEPLQLDGHGEAQVPAGYADALRRALGDVADKTRPRLRFIGYTRNERLDRRTAMVYGDDVGLSAARARRAMDKLKAEPVLADAPAEHEGRGYVQSDDVVNAGFVQGESSYVVVQVVYDELAALDDYEGVQVTPITRELTPKDPLALNLMRITVDGEPIDDPGRSLADIQRCTDVALDDAEIQFGFDDLKAVPRLSVTADPIAAPVPAGGGEGAAASPVQLPELHELRALDRSLRGADLREGPVGPGGAARGGRRWTGWATRSGSPTRRGSSRRCASSSTCCAPTTSTGSSTRPSRSRSG